MGQPRQQFEEQWELYLDYQNKCGHFRKINNQLNEYNEVLTICIFSLFCKLTHAQQLFTFGDTYRGNYANSISNAASFYKYVAF